MCRDERLLGTVRVSRYKAPTADGELLAVPPLSELPALWESNRRLLDTSATMVAGLPLKQFRSESAQEVIQAAQDYLTHNNEPNPKLTGTHLLGAGHQP